MEGIKKKLTAGQKAAKKKRRQEFMTLLFNGKQKRVKRPAAEDGFGADDYLRQNADPVWLHQNEMWECLEAALEDQRKGLQGEGGDGGSDGDGRLSFDRKPSS
jgi:hypothetical protein